MSRAEPAGATGPEAPSGATRLGGLDRLRADARGILDAAIAAGDAGALVNRALAFDGRRLVVAGRTVDLGLARRILVVGAGKAAGAMAAAVERALAGGTGRADPRLGGLVVVREAAGPQPAGIPVVEAGHPLPDARGEAAARTILELAGEAGADDVVICLLSGGGSALLPAPVPGVTLAEKEEVTRLLLQAGATIGQLNAVRKHLSTLKGGRLARAVHPATLITLLLSDVIGDPLDVIASGPTVPDPTTYREALAVLDGLGLRDRAPASVRRHLLAGAAGRREESPKPGDPVFERATTVVVGNNGVVVEAALAEARRRGYPPLLLTRRLQGEAREVARVLGAIAREAADTGRPVGRPGCLVAAGETTVTVRGAGKGGRCQELALALAVELEGLPEVAALAAGTDGSDGPTPAAGAHADGSTLARAARAGLDAATALAANDAYHFFAGLGDLVVTGPTGTNLLDLYLVLVGPPAGVPPSVAVPQSSADR